MQDLCVPYAASWLKVSNLCPHCRALGHYTDAEQTSRLMIHVNRGNAGAYSAYYKLQPSHLTTALVVFGARAGRLALPVSLCLFGASTADCTKRKVIKPKGACWEAYKVAMVAEFQAMKDSPDADPGGVMTPQHWDIAEQIVRVRIEGGAAHGEGRKVGLILPHHT
ncbi:hypothetical protein M885DRAFT_626357, partial [Pelagophyceae sp. CCMP2097]